MNHQSFLASVNPQFLLVMSKALQTLRPSLIAFLIANAQALSGGMPNPISLCNLLFVGNLCAAIVVVIWFGWKPILTDLQQMPRSILIELFINGCLAAALSALIFVGLEYTTVTNSVLLGRLGPILFALAGAVIWKQAISKAEWLGFLFILVGILVIVLISNNFRVNLGDLLIIGSAVVYALTSIIGKFMLSKETPLRTVIFTRNFISSVVFFLTAIALFGPKHFGEAFAGQLWIMMMIYALVLIVLAQFLWYAALGRLDSRAVGRWTSMTPIFGVFFAFILNGERPSLIQFISFLVIMIGVWISTLGKSPPSKSKERAIEMAVMEANNENPASAT